MTAEEVRVCAVFAPFLLMILLALALGWDR
jgi:hypothetical protein